MPVKGAKAVEEAPRSEQCKTEVGQQQRYREAIPAIVDELVLSCGLEDCFDHVGPEPIPSREAVVDAALRACRILYPGYFIRTRLDQVNLGYYFGQELTAFFELLAAEITHAIRHECLRYDQPCTHCEERGQEVAVAFMRQLPRLRSLLAKDVRAAYEGDPAAKGYDEVIFSYPGLFAVTVYRVAHQLLQLGVPLIPRIMTEYAHSRTGIDIHPGADIGERFFIDHGTGVVVGETTVIGRRVRLYQGVTLGALSVPREDADRLRDQKRHPTIEDEVIIYAGATILGGDTLIGARSVIGGNVWLTESVPPDTLVVLKNPELIFRNSSATGQLQKIAGQRS